jgi:ABC-type multidrug transport system permease subunit
MRISQLVTLAATFAGAADRPDLPAQLTLLQALEIAPANSINPLRYMVMIVRGITLKNPPWTALWPNLLALVVFAIVLFAISAWRFRKQ